MVNLYLDGCSFTYGTGLDKDSTLAELFSKAGYSVLNFSRPGKSNTAIAQDVYHNLNNASIFVLGFSYSARYFFQFDDLDIDLLPSNYNWQYRKNDSQGEDVNFIVNNLHKSFYALFDQSYWNNFSDMLVDSTINNLKIENKKFFIFSWERRNTKNKLFYPVVHDVDRLPDGHLNKNGTKKLFDTIQNTLGNP